MSCVTAGDIPIRNKVFGAFYVLLGAGIVAAFFSILSNNVLEVQEQLMQKRFVAAANAMTEIIERTAVKVRAAQREKLQQYYTYVYYFQNILPSVLVFTLLFAF